MILISYRYSVWRSSLCNEILDSHLLGVFSEEVFEPDGFALSLYSFGLRAKIFAYHHRGVGH